MTFPSEVTTSPAVRGRAREARWAAYVAAAPRSHAMRVLLAAAPLVAVAMILGAFNVAGQSVVWENAHWTVAWLAGFVAVAIGAREADDALDRRVRGAFTFGMASIALGQIVRDIQVAAQFSGVPAPSDFLFLAGALTVCYGVFVAVRERVTRSAATIVYLDATTLLIATATVLVAAYGATTYAGGVVPGAIALAYPVLFVTTACAIAVAALSMRVAPDRWGAYPLLAGVVLLATYWVASLSFGVAGPPPGSAINYLVPVAALLTAYGAASWRSAESADPEYKRVAATIMDLLPLGAVLLSTGLLVLPSGDNARFDAVDVGAMAVVALAVVRQALLLRERMRIVTSERAAREQAVGALLAQREAEVHDRSVVEVFKHLSDRITFAGDESDLVHAAAVALQRLVPSPSANVLLIDPTEEKLTVAAAWGEGSGEPGTPASIARPMLCPGIRRGSVFLAVQVADDIAVRCRALRVERGSVLCVPMLALGKIVGVIHLARPEPDAFDSKAQRLAVSVAEQVALAVANARLMHTMEGLAMTDPLTRLNNARFFDPYLERQLALSTREGQPMGLILIDIDHFKQFNDSYGHPAGDEALRTFARTLLSALRESDTVGRYGGEEFIVALPQTDLQGTHDAAEKVRKAVEAMPVEVGPGRFARITVSLGVVSSLEHGTDRLSLVRAADRALYRAKQLGRNRTAMPEPRSGGGREGREEREGRDAGDRRDGGAGREAPIRAAAPRDGRRDSEAENAADDAPHPTPLVVLPDDAPRVAGGRK